MLEEEEYRIAPVEDVDARWHRAEIALLAAIVKFQELPDVENIGRTNSDEIQWLTVCVYMNIVGFTATTTIMLVNAIDYLDGE